MNIQRSPLAYAATLIVSVSSAHAGPCSLEITRTEEQIVAMVDAKAQEARAPESTAAKMHRQPTPNSIAAAEVELGLISQEQFNAVKSALVRAREADRAGDQSICEQALADVKRLLGP